MKSLTIAMFLPACLFGQFVNKDVTSSFDYPEKVKTVVRTSVTTDDYDGDESDTVTEVRTCRFDEKGAYTYYQTKENGEVIYEFTLAVRDNGRTLVSNFKHTALDSVVTKLDDKGNPVTTTSYEVNGKIHVNNFQYDKNGNKTVHAVNLRDSMITRKYAYDKENRLVSETEFRKPLKGGKDQKFSERIYSYNMAGLKTKEIHKSFSGKNFVADTTSFTYNAQNKVATRIYSNGTFSNTYRFAYDANGNMIQEDFSTTEELDYDASMSEKWTFDPQGYWASYLQIVDDEEIGAEYTTVYNADGLPLSCTIVDLGRENRVSWTYEYH